MMANRVSWLTHQSIQLQYSLPPLHSPNILYSTQTNYQHSPTSFTPHKVIILRLFQYHSHFSASRLHIICLQICTIYTQTGTIQSSQFKKKISSCLFGCFKHILSLILTFLLFSPHHHQTTPHSKLWMHSKIIQFRFHILSLAPPALWIFQSAQT